MLFSGAHYVHTNPGGRFVLHGDAKMDSRSLKSLFGMAPTSDRAAPLQKSGWSWLWVELELSVGGVWLEEYYQLQNGVLSVWIAHFALGWHECTSMMRPAAKTSMWIKLKYQHITR
jgi:hypothetical protein